MQIVFHVGVHCTDGDRVLKTLLNNRDELLEFQTEIVPPARHRGLFVDALKSLGGGAANAEMEQVLLDAILHSDDPERIILTSPNFLGLVSRMVDKNGLYSDIGSRLGALTNLFPRAEGEFFLAIRNPATLLSEALSSGAGADQARMLQSCDPADLRWWKTIQRLVRSAQGRRVVVWCHEDVPLIWPEVIRTIADLPPGTPLHDGLIYMHQLLTDEGKVELNRIMSGRDQLSISQRREIQSQLLDKHAIPGALDQDINIPGWTQETVDEVSKHYYRDVAEIAALPGVEFILP